MSTTTTRPDIQQQAYQYLQENIECWPCHSNRASQLDDQCLRRLVYRRTHWQLAKPTEPGLQGVFETGKELEPVVERILSTLGHKANPEWRVVGSQSTLDKGMQDRYQITGHIDGVLETKSGLSWSPIAVADIKTCSPSVYDALYDYDSLDKYPWTRKYRGQMMLYMLGKDIEQGVLIFVNKSNLYQIKTIWFALDYDYAEGLLQKAEAVNLHIENKTLPDKLNRPDECMECPFAHVCCPDLIATGNQKFIEDEYVEDLLKKYCDLQQDAKEFGRVDKALKDALIKGQEIVCGDYLVTWKSHKRNGSDVWKKTVQCTLPIEHNEDIREAS